MNSRALLMGAAALLIGGGVASAQMQYDSLGAPTPAPDQKTSPNKVEPNIPQPSDGLNTGASTSSTPSAVVITPESATTTGAATSSDKRDQSPDDTGVTPGGLTPD